MICENCKTPFEGGFCPKCGAKAKKEGLETFKNYLYDSSENVVAVLGNNTAQTFVSTGVLGNGFAILSDKRVYFKGKCLIRKGKGFYSKVEEKSVDIDDITGTGFVHSQADWAKALYIIFFVLFIMELLVFVIALINGVVGAIAGIVEVLISGGLALLFKFLYNRYNYSAFEISYAGGGIAFDMHWITDVESKEFQRCVNLLKDQLKSEKNKVKPDSSNATNIPEQLLKYKELLKQGVITEEEFDMKKKHLLNL